MISLFDHKMKGTDQISFAEGQQELLPAALVVVGGADAAAARIGAVVPFCWKFPLA